MRFIPMVAIAVAGISLAGSAVAQISSPSSALSNDKDRAYGYVDLKTGMFHPVSELELSPAPEATSTKTYTGTLEVTITTTISATTALPKGTTILCSVSMTGPLFLSGYGSGFPSQYSSHAATISGDTAKCTVDVPYSWPGLDAGALYNATYQVTASYVPSATQPITQYNIVAQAAGPVTPQAGGALPANGTVTKVAIETTI